MVADLHLHSRFSFDSGEEAKNYVIMAQSLGADRLGFSEHYDYDAVLDGADGVVPCDLKAYVATIENLWKQFPRTEILLGVEFGYRDDVLPKYRELIDEYDFDYVINSVHTVKGCGGCFHERFFEWRTLRQSYADYLSAVLESVKADFDYQIIGHIGYVSRYHAGENHKIKYEDFSEIFDLILMEIIARGKCLEINVSVGKHDWLCLPDEGIIKRYVELGGEKLSFGSDAHRASALLKNCDEIVDFLKSIGVERLFYYKKRQAVAYKI